MSETKEQVKQLTTTVHQKTSHHRWQVKNFSGLDPTHGSRIYSPTFTALDQTWKWCLYPGGQSKTKDAPIMVSLFIEPVDLAKSTRGHLRLFIVCPATGELLPRIVRSSITWTNNRGFGAVSLVPRNELLDETKGAILNDTVTFAADIAFVELENEGQDESKVWEPEEYPETSFTWKILNFSKQTPGSRMESNQFGSGGRTKWKVYLKLPKDKEEFLSVYLLSQNKRCHSVNFQIAILSGLDSVLERTSVRTEIVPLASNGWPKYVKQVDLLDAKKGYIVDDTLIIQVKVTVVKRCSDQVLEQEKDVHLNFKDLLSSDALSDVTIYIAEQKIPAHQCILAAHSAVFRAMFESKMRESQERELHLVDVDKDVVDVFMHFLYTGEHEKKSTLPRLVATFILAHRYQVTKLEVICSAKIAKELNNDNFVSTYLLAEQYDNSLLKSECARFLNMSDKRQQLMTDMLAKPRAHVENSIIKSDKKVHDKLPQEIVSTCCIIS